MERILVKLEGRAYPILLGAGILSGLGEAVRERMGGDRICIVTDSRVARFYLPLARKSLEKAGYQVFSQEVPEGEETKSLAWVSKLYDFLIEMNLDRGSGLVALGGGVVGDLAGFVAATYLRGIPYAQVPTSLVAQVDASVGGKTGVNHPLGKNLIGAFYQPWLVYTDVRLLTTLPRRDFLAGLAELVKYGAIRDAGLFAYLEERLPDVLGYDEEALLYLVRESCRIKAEIVEKDEREEGVRTILNFGHTLGHAVETLTQYSQFKHGEATAIGMVFAAEVSCAQGLLPRDEARRLRKLLSRAGLPTDFPDFPRKDYEKVVARDKKGKSGLLNFVLIGPLGQATLRPMRLSEILRIHR